MEKRNLKINAGIIDLTDVRPETIDGYDSIKLNCGVGAITPASRRVLNEHSASMNIGMQIDVPDGARLQMQSGTFELSGDANVNENDALMVSGTLRLLPGSEEAIRKYAKIIVSGSVVLPESLRGMLSLIDLRGSSVVYPDAAAYVDGNITVNRRFARMAKQDGMFYTTDSAYLTDENVDVNALLDKNVVIHAEKAYVSDDLPDGELLFDAETEVVNIPSGYSFVDDSLTIGDYTADQHGKKLFVNGSVTADKNSAKGLEQIEQIITTGTAKVHRDVMELWSSRCVSAGKLKQTDDVREISDLDECLINAALLNVCPDGVNISDCNVVNIDPDTEPALLAEKVRQMSDISACICTTDQQGVLQLVSEEVNFVRERPAKEDKSEDSSNDVRINTGIYKL